MQLNKRFTGQVSGVALASMVATGVSTSTSLVGCVALHTALRPGSFSAAPAVFYDPNKQAWPQAVPAGTLRALWPQMVYQRTDASCSVASVTVVINALRHTRGLAPLTQEAVVASDRSGRWWQATQSGGQGLDLDAAHLLLLTAAASLGDVPRDGHVGVHAVHVPALQADAGAVVEAKQALAFALGRMNQQPEQVFVVLNFEQSRLLHGGAHEGHLSVVGGYDEALERVLILDVDDDHYRPYWVPLQALLVAMQQPDDATGEPRGYLVVVRDR